MNTENLTLRLSLAIFAAIVIHTIIAIGIYWLDVTLIEPQHKTVPFKLISSNSSLQSKKQSTLSTEENARAAQEYLATLSQSQFNTTISDNTPHSTNKRDGRAKNTPALSKPKPSNIQNLSSFSRSTQSQAIDGLQGIFSRNNQQLASEKVKQVSDKELDKLSDYEISLLNALAKDTLYDPFHEVMQTNNKKEVSYTITLNLFPNGAIKAASIRETSGLEEIDKLAILVAYRASPFPAPPHEDIQKGFRYHIPILYQGKKSIK